MTAVTMTNAQRKKNFSLLRAYMTLRDESAADIAKVIGSTSAYVSNCMTGKAQWRLNDIYTIMEFLDITEHSIEEVFPKDGKMAEVKTKAVPTVQVVAEALRAILTGGCEPFLEGSDHG